MSEDLPLDPNQVQPPQEGEATHIDVTSHDGGDSRVDDIDKARDMAEAGDEYRTKAREHREGAQGTKNFYQEGSPLNSMTPAGRAEYHDKQAEGAEKFAGEVYDEAQTSDHSNNADKAKQMILAERARERNLAAPTPKEAGDKYDLERAEKEMGKPLAEALKEGSKDKAEAIFLHYSHLIAERSRKDGDTLSPNLEALDLAYKFVGGWRTLQEHGHNKWVEVRYNHRLDGSIDITKTNGPLGTTAEKWHIPMFNKVPYNSGYDRSSVTDTAYYEVAETSQDSDGQFDRVQVKKTRSLGEADVANLKKAFGAVRAFKIEQDEGTLHPGDEGYEEELAEINYGRD